MDQQRSGWGELYGAAETLAGGVAAEGAHLLTDPVGAADRLIAQQQLRGGFDVVDDGATGPRLPNEVTSDELRATAATFSDVRLGRKDLTIDPGNGSAVDPAAFKDGAMHDIAALLQTNTGRAEVAQLSNNVVTGSDGKSEHRHTTIEPYLATDKKTGRETLATGAETNPEDAGAAVLKRDGSRQPGSSSHLHYNPGREARHSRSDVVLAHEMRHSLDETHGNMDNTPIDRSDGVPSDVFHGSRKIGRYEHQATGLGKYAKEPLNENHYRDERRQIGASGDPATALPGDDQMPPRPFYKKF